MEATNNTTQTGAIPTGVGFSGFKSHSVTPIERVNEAKKRRQRVKRAGVVKTVALLGLVTTGQLVYSTDEVKQPILKAIHAAERAGY